MPILKATTTGGGASISWHRVSKIEVGLLDAHNVAVLTVHSWPSIDAYIENQGGMFTWTSYVPLPLAVLAQGPDVLGACQQALVSQEGCFLNGGSIAEAPSDLDMARQLRWAQIKQTRALLSTGVIEFEGLVYDGDDTAVDNIMRSIAKMRVLGEESRRWTLADNTAVSLTVAKLEQLGAAIGDRTDNCHEITRTLYRRVMDPALTDVAQVAAVIWPTDPEGHPITKWAQAFPELVT